MVFILFILLCFLLFSFTPVSPEQPNNDKDVRPFIRVFNNGTILRDYEAIPIPLDAVPPRQSYSILSLKQQITPILSSNLTMSSNMVFILFLLICFLLISFTPVSPEQPNNDKDVRPFIRVFNNGTILRDYEAISLDAVHLSKFTSN
ncbi:hypothetical protein vseg_006712 [Gypsophila vaccaria]